MFYTSALRPFWASRPANRARDFANHGSLLKRISLTSLAPSQSLRCGLRTAKAIVIGARKGGWTGGGGGGLDWLTISAQQGACLHPPTERRVHSSQLTLSLSCGAPSSGGGEAQLPDRLLGLSRRGQTESRTNNEKRSL